MIQPEVICRVVIALCEHQLSLSGRPVRVGDGGCVGLDDPVDDGDVGSGAEAKIKGKRIRGSVYGDE